MERPEIQQCSYKDKVPDGTRVPFARSLERFKYLCSTKLADIYVASYEQDLSDLYAIKFVSATKADFEGSICLEVEYLKRLEHCNVPKYFGLDFSRKLKWFSPIDETKFPGINYFLTLRYYPGNDLSLWAKERQHSPPDHSYIQRFLRDLLHGLHYLHSHDLRIIHCDIKPGNLVLHSDFTDARVVIIDFDGVAFNHQLKSEGLTTAFTPFYASPELFLALADNLPTGRAAEIGGKIDVWSVGCVAIQLCTGEPPIICKCINGVPNPDAPLDSFMNIVMRISDGTARPLQLNLDNSDPWNQSLLDFISQCLQFDTNTRMSAQELLNHEYITTPYEAL